MVGSDLSHFHALAPWWHPLISVTRVSTRLYSKYRPYSQGVSVNVTTAARSEQHTTYTPDQAECNGGYKPPTPHQYMARAVEA